MRDARGGAGPALALHHLIELRLGGIGIAIRAGEIIRQRLALALHRPVRRDSSRDTAGIQAAAELVAPVRAR